MDIYELDSYRLSDAVKFHDDLNPALWDGMQMRPEVRTALLRVADDFREFLGIDDLAVEDITVSGSNAAYSYTPHSDIDLHLIVDFSQLNPDQVYQELFNAKKYQYNDQHDIKIRGYDVELYVQDSNKPVRSLGEYSIKNDDWTRIPVRRRGNLDEKSTKAKYEKLRDLIELALKSDDLDRIKNITDTIKKYRQAGLDEGGEFGPENLAFKMLRTQGLIKRLWDHRADLEDQRLSLAERKRKKKKSKKRFTYGSFGGWFYPGYNNDSGATADAGGDGGGGESVQEQEESQSDVIDRFAKSCCDFLGMEQQPRIRLRRDPQWSEVNNTFGRYDPDSHSIELAVSGRHIQDILRTLAHEMTHARQNEVADLPDHAGETGSSWEDSANAMAGRIMRHWAESEPKMFAEHQLDEQLDQPTPSAQEIIRKHDMTEQDFIRQLKMGIKVEMEHTTDARAAMEIAMDHINERPDYYDMLAAVERPMGEDAEIDEDWRRAAGAAAAAACIAGTPGCATTGSGTLDALRTVQTVGRTAQTMKDMGRAGAEEELKGAVRDALRRQRGQIPEASGYIPTEKQKNDPRFKTALTVDIRPGQTGKEANKLGLKTDSQGRPDLLMKNLANLLESIKLGEDEELTEVKMSPAEFQKFLKSPAAEGIRAGFEAELIFRDTQSDVDGGESEPDYDADERAYSIDDIISFFTGGEGGIGPGTARRLQDQLTEAFADWARESFYDNYFDQARFLEWADDNVWPEVDDQYRDQARDNLDDEEATDEQVEAEAVTLFHDDVERDWDRSGDWYDRAQEELYDEYYGDLDQSDWLDQADLRYMSNVAEEYGLDWPYWTDGSGSGGTRDWQEIANSLERVTGMPVRVSGGYHGAARRPGQYIIEPDSSLDSDDSDDYGLEVVSPPLPLPEAIEQLNRIIDWANGPGDAYTNSSTGLHMGVSLPFKGGDVDPVKLILFMGDQNVLETFGRESNTYARSAYERLESKIRGMKNAKQIAGVMELMKRNLIELADREFKKGGLLGDKYVSVHPQDGYIEFRGPGGDYLAKSDEIDGVLENTMLRLAYAMSIAGDPAVARQEYAKKLYKMLTGYRGAEISKGPRDTKYQTKIETEGENPFMRLFSDYSAGMLSGEELKAKWADTVLAAERGDVEDDDVEDVPMGTPQEYEVYDRATGEVYTTFQARNDDEAVEQFSRHHRAPYARRGLPVLRVKGPVQREYEVVDRRTGTPGDQDSYKVIDTFSAANDTEAAEMAMNKWAGQGIDFVVRKKAREEPKSQKPKSRRAELAKRVTRSTRDVGEQLWRVNHHSSQRWVVARSQAEAVAKAVQQDRMFDSPETRARIATDLEKQQWQLDQEARALRQRDSEQDAEQIRARLGAPQAAGGEPTGEWSVRDREGFLVTTLRPPEAMQSQDGAERYAQNWIARSRPDLDASDITVTQLTVEREPIPGSTLDIQRQRQQGEFTGAWEIRDGQGRELHRFSGIGNNQADANRFAASWLGRNRPDLAGQEVDVVPVMR